MFWSGTKRELTKEKENVVVLVVVLKTLCAAAEANCCHVSKLLIQVLRMMLSMMEHADAAEIESMRKLISL